MISYCRLPGSKLNRLSSLRTNWQIEFKEENVFLVGRSVLYYSLIDPLPNHQRFAMRCAKEKCKQFSQSRDSFDIVVSVCPKVTKNRTPANAESFGCLTS